jgi:hypothetical protein
MSKATSFSHIYQLTTNITTDPITTTVHLRTMRIYYPTLDGDGISVGVGYPPQLPEQVISMSGLATGAR